MSDIDYGNEPNNDYNPNYNPQQDFQQSNIPMNPEQTQVNYPPNNQFVPQPENPYEIQNPVQQEQQWYNQPPTLTPQEQAWYEQPPQEQTYCGNPYPQQQPQQYQPLVQTVEPPNKKKEKRRKQKKKFRLSFTGIILILIALAIIFFTSQHFINEAFLDNHLPDEPFQYTADADYRDYITSDIVLPDVLGDEEKSYEILWESSHPDILSSDGVVNRPTDKNQTVTLTMKLKRGFWYSQREYEVVVIKSEQINPENIFVLTDEMIENGISTNEFLITYNEDGSIYSIDGNFNNTLIESESDALVVIDAYRDLLNISNDISFKFENVQTSLIGKTYSFVPVKNDVQIAGQRIIISTNNNYLSTITTTVKNVDVSDVSLSDDELAEIAKTHLELNSVKISGVEKSYHNDSIAYKFTAFDEETGKGMWIVIVDASTKEVLSAKSAFDSSWETVKGSGKDEMGNKQTFNTTKDTSVLGIYYHFKDSARNISIIDGTIANFGAMYYMDSINPITQVKNNWDKHPQGVSCMTNLAKVYDWYKDTLGFKSFDGKGQPIYCFIEAERISEDVEDNAAYVGGDVQVFFCGSGKSSFRYAPFAQLDVTAHEFAHGVFHHVAYRGFNDGVMMESINEGYSDIFGCLVEGNWILAEKVINGYDALRDPSGTATNLMYIFPETYLDENWDYTDGHNNSILLSRAAYQMTQQGFTENDVARIWFQSLYYGYDDYSNFLTVRNHVEQAARDLGYSEEQLVVIGDIFGSMKIGEMATRQIESFSVEGDRLRDNTTEKTYIVVLSPIGTVVANTPIWIFEEDKNVSSTATDTEMSDFLSTYASNYLNSMSDDMTWNVSVEYSKYSPWAMDIMGRFVDEAKQGMLGEITNASGMETEDANVLLSMAFFAFKFEGTAYEFFSEIFELDYSKLIVGEDGTISYDFT